MDLVASKLRKNQQMKLKNGKKKKKQKRKKQGPLLLLALNGLILPAADLCCIELFLPFSLNDNYYVSLSDFHWGGPWHGHGESLMSPCQELHNMWGCSELCWKTNACNFSAEEIQQLHCWNDLESFGGSSLVVLAETGVGKRKVDGGRKKLLLGGLFLSEG